MPKKRKIQEKKNRISDIKWGESYISLALGALVILLVVSLTFVFARNKTFDRINTSDSTVELTKPQSQDYEVKNGDTLWSISEKLYGSGYNWVDLAKANSLSNPGVIEVGTKLKIPNVQKITVASIQPVQNNSPSISGENYEVVEGDHLWGIAVRAYGDGYKWPEIAKANSIPNPDLIYTGSTLKLPR